MAFRAVQDFTRDLRYSFRLLRKSPLFSLYVIAPLALGIGLNGAIFMLLDALLLRPLPVHNPSNLVRIAQDVQNLGIRSYYQYDLMAAIQKNSRSLTDIFGYAELISAVRDSSGASRVRGHVVTGNFFSALGVPALYGRVLTESDALQAAAAPPVVLSYPYWLREFHGDRNAIGRTLSLGDRPFTVVGVMPQFFNGLEVETTPDIRLPLIAGGLLATNTEQNSYRNLIYTLGARLRPGVSLASARDETDSIARAVATDGTPGLARDERLVLEPMDRGVSLLRPRFSAALLLLMSGVGLVLAMICANVGGLLLARASARQGDAAVRLALGASTGRLMRQSLTESLVLTSIGGAIGITLAFLTAPLLLRTLPTVRDLAATVLTLSVDLRPDWRIAAFSIALCVVCALFAGIPAAWNLRQISLQTSMKSVRTTARLPLRWALVAVQIGLCTFLLAGAGLLISTFSHLRSMDPGFDRDHVVVFSLDPDMAHYSPQQVINLHERLVQEVRALPGVQSAGTGVLGLMHGTGMKTTIALPGEKVQRREFMNTSLNFVTPEYFDSMGIPILAGRNLSAADAPATPERVLVNRAFVKRFFRDRDPLGQTFGGAPPDKISKPDMQIAGVVGDAKYRSLREIVPPTVYHLWARDPKSAGRFILHVRTTNRPESAIEAVRKILYNIDPSLPFYEVRTLAQEVDGTLWAERLLAWLSSVFAIVAAILATLGVYSTLAYAIAQSRREIGIRVALGASAAHVLKLFSARPVWIAVGGVIAGLAAFYASRPAFQSVLYDVSPADPITMFSSAAGVLFMAALATLVATGAALRVDPAVVLRDE